MLNQWELVPDGEFNEQFTVIDGKRVTIYSDRDGREWGWCVGSVEASDDLMSLDAECRDDARKEAVSEFNFDKNFGKK